MSVMDVMAAIVTIEESIVLPAAVVTANNLTQYKQVKKAHTLRPGQAKNLNDLPCFINWYDDEPEVLRMGNFVEYHETIQVDYYGPEGDLAHMYALAYFDATMAAFIAEQPYTRRFGGSVDMVDVRSSSPAIQLETFNEKPSAGFTLYLDLIRFETVVPV